MLTRIDVAAMDAETVQMLSIIDEEKDANIIINPEGIIQFANKGVTAVSPAHTAHNMALCNTASDPQQSFFWPYRLHCVGADVFV